MIIYSEKMQLRLNELTHELDSLPSLPESIQRINQMIDSKQSTLNAVGEEISKDPALSAQVLQLVNSSFYGFPGKVSSIKHAVVLLGLNAIRTLMSSSWIIGLSKDFSQGFHHHAMATAQACFVLSRALGIGEPEECVSLGLLHDLGKVILAKYLPEEFEQAQALALKEHICIHDAEQQTFGVNHAALSATLLRNWHLPNDTVIPIEYHHHTELPNQYADESALLMLANLMVRAEGFGAVADNAMPEFHEVIATQLNLKLSDLQLLSDEICDKMQTIPHYIKGKAL